MVEVLGATTTTKEVLSGVNLHGKRILVTAFRRDLVWKLRGPSLRTALRS